MCNCKTLAQKKCFHPIHTRAVSRASTLVRSEPAISHHIISDPNVKHSRSQVERCVAFTCILLFASRTRAPPWTQKSRREVIRPCPQTANVYARTTAHTNGTGVFANCADVRCRCGCVMLMMMPSRALCIALCVCRPIARNLNTESAHTDRTIL